MKKILSILCGCFMALNVFAFPSITTIIDITLSSANGENRTISLYEGPEFSDAYDDGFDSADPNATGFYVLDATGGKWLSWATDNLEGTRLGFTANDLDDQYTLTFNNVEGRNLFIYDAVSGEAKPIVNGQTVVSTIESSQAGLAIDFRFSILEEAPVFLAQVTTNEFGWASFSFDQDLAAFEADLKIYTGVFDGGETLNLTEMDWYAQNEGVVVFGAPNTTYHFVAGVPQQSSFDGNDLKASSRWANGHSGSVFCLRGDALYEYTGADFPANKAYLEIPASNPNGAPRRISFRFGGTQAVDNVADEAKAVKFMENGQVFVIKNGVKFNTLGQIVK